MKITIPELTPSSNRVYRMHWSKQRKLSKDWAWLVRIYLEKAEGELPDNSLPQRVHIKSYRVSLCDKDRFIGGLFGLIDGLVKNNLIFDDSEEWLTLTAEQVKVKNRIGQKTEVIISSCQTNNDTA